MAPSVGERLLTVDDDPNIRAVLRRVLRPLPLQITAAGNGHEALAVLAQHPPGTFAVAIVDLCMPGMDGLSLLGEIKRSAVATQILILTAHGTIPSTVRAMRLGADDFLEKPFRPDDLRERVRIAVRVWRAIRAHEAERHSVSGDPFEHLIGSSPVMRQIQRLARRLGATNATVLVQGESGTGKEQFARAVHRCGDRAAEPFVSIDTAALNPTVIESELYGHSRGAFTGATDARIGLIRSAGKGTVFLDEIGDLPLDMQTRLLRLLQQREARPVGSEDVYPVEARFIAATNRDLAKLVAQGRFREDLYHRLNVIATTMPPLRVRAEDIPSLAEHFLIACLHERPTVLGLSPEALALLQSYDWPGNVRELENAILRAVILGTSDWIQPRDLPASLQRMDDAQTATASAKSDSGAIRSIPVTSGITSAPAGTLAEWEREAILSALQESRGNRAQAAAILKIAVSTLYRKLKRHGLNESAAQPSTSSK